MKKLLWVSIGVGIGVLASKKYTEISSGAALNRQIGRYADRISDMTHAFSSAMQAREEELRSALGVNDTK